MKPKTLKAHRHILAAKHVEAMVAIDTDVFAIPSDLRELLLVPWLKTTQNQPILPVDNAKCLDGLAQSDQTILNDLAKGS